jgi:hypothetical protein
VLLFSAPVAQKNAAYNDNIAIIVRYCCFILVLPIPDWKSPIGFSLILLHLGHIHLLPQNDRKIYILARWMKGKIKQTIEVEGF